MYRRPSEVLQQNRELIRSIALLHRTENLRVFGSVLRGEDTETSDLPKKFRNQVLSEAVPV